MTLQDLLHKLKQRVYVDYFDGNKIAFTVERTNSRVTIDFTRGIVTAKEGEVSFDPDTCQLEDDEFWTGRPFYKDISIK